MQIIQKGRIVATGGIRNGIQVAKAIGLGAKCCGIGLPLFRAALASEEGPVEELSIILDGFKTAMVASGCQTPSELRSKLLLTNKFREECELYL